METEKLPTLASVQTCTLCGSCKNTCPTDAISFIKNYLDFSYPEVDASKCVGCKQCEKKCPVVTPLQVDVTLENCSAWIGRNPDEQVRKQSTSGGVFYAAAEYVLQQGGYVCGAVFDNDFHVKHICSNQISDVRKMMGSKYAQSDMGNVYQQVVKLLERGIPVLFTGCPCQVAGLKAFLRKDYDSLMTIELICHGVPSDRMLQEYLSMQKAKYKAKPQNIVFRSKRTGWLNSSIEIKFENNKFYKQLISVDGYMKGYFGNVTLKESCYKCQFRSFRSGSDCMMGDFWGAEVEKHPFDNKSGISAIIAQGNKGTSFIKKLNLNCQEWSVDGVVKYNKTITTSQSPSLLRAEFYEYSKKYGYSKAMKKYFFETPDQMIKRKLRYAMRFWYYRLSGKGTPPY